jgi:hypothetical protein
MNKIEHFFTEYKNTITVLSGLVIVLSFFMAATNYINSEIEKKITDETYINKLSKTLRPFAIFDLNGAIQYDHGAEKYIEKIEIKKKENGDISTIKIITRVFLQNPPILNYTGYENYAYVSKKIDTYVWLFTLSSQTLLLGGSNEKFDPIVMIEILK